MADTANKAPASSLRLREARPDQQQFRTERYQYREGEPVHTSGKGTAGLHYQMAMSGKPTADGPCPKEEYRYPKVEYPWPREGYLCPMVAYRSPMAASPCRLGKALLW